MFLCLEGSLDGFGTTSGSIWEQLWGHFELIFFVFLRFSMMCPIFLQVLWCCVFPPGGFVFITENVEENEKGEGEPERQRGFRQSIPLSANESISAP